MAEETKPQEAVQPEEPRVSEKQGMSWTRLLLYSLALLLLFLVVGFLTIGVTIGESAGGVSYPYTTTYLVLFPGSEVVRIGNTEIVAIPMDEKATISVNREVTEVLKGETREIGKRTSTISFLGIPLLSFDFLVDATYLGKVGTGAQFYFVFKTSRQVPSFLIERLLPPNVEAQPV